MGKVVKFTGSRVLGAELKRMRGKRTLAEISKLTKTPPFSDRIRPISAPTLCQVESGQTMPTLDTLHSLATVYRASPQRLYDLIAQDRLVAAHSVPEDTEGIRAQFRAAVHADEWDQALALAIQGESLAADDRERVKWRANRATAMRKLGMAQDAIWLMHECADDPAATDDHRSRILANLADSYGRAGLPTPAADCLARAVALAPADSPAAIKSRMLRMRAALLIRQVEWGLTEDERPVRQAQQLLKEARSLLTEPSAYDRLGLDLECAATLKLLNNRVLAARDLARIADEASACGESAIEMWAHEALGVLRREEGKLRDARRELERAEAVAAQLGDADEIFHINFELYEVAIAAGSSDGHRQRLLRRCRRYYPLLTMNTPAVRRFEQIGAQS